MLRGLAEDHGDVGSAELHRSRALEAGVLTL